MKSSAGRNFFAEAVGSDIGSPSGEPLRRLSITGLLFYNIMCEKLGYTEYND